VRCFIDAVLGLIRPVTCAIAWVSSANCKFRVSKGLIQNRVRTRREEESELMHFALNNTIKLMQTFHHKLDAVLHSINL
jgi:hypothetical protein